jgi:Na+-transporting NADH:ubiquinone oxidoreductase subunit NqrF
LKSNLAHKKIIKYEVLISLLSNPKIKSNHFDDFKHYKDVHFILVRNKTTPAKVLNFIFNFKENYQDDWDKINIWNRIAVNPNTDTETVLALSKKGYNMTDHPNYPENMRKVRKLLKIS